MRLPCKTKIEKAWLVVSLSILFLHRMLGAPLFDYDPPVILMRLWLEMAMIVLSFPLGGLLMFIIRDAVYWCDECGNLGWVLDWSVLLLAGYIQWFWVLPEFLRGRQLTFLNLRQPAAVALPELSEPHTETPHVLTPTAESLPFPPAEFDEAGLTALDRVLRAEASAPPAR